MLEIHFHPKIFLIYKHSQKEKCVIIFLDNFCRC